MKYLVYVLTMSVMVAGLTCPAQSAAELLLSDNYDIGGQWSGNLDESLSTRQAGTYAPTGYYWTEANYGDLNNNKMRMLFDDHTYYQYIMVGNADFKSYSKVSYSLDLSPDILGNFGSLGWNDQMYVLLGRNLFDGNALDFGLQLFGAYGPNAGSWAITVSGSIVATGTGLTLGADGMYQVNMFSEHGATANDVTVTVEGVTLGKWAYPNVGKESIMLRGLADVPALSINEIDNLLIESVLVPEPTSLMTVGLSLAALAGYVIRRRK